MYPLSSCLDFKHPYVCPSKISAASGMFQYCVAAKINDSRCLFSLPKVRPAEVKGSERMQREGK